MKRMSWAFGRRLRLSESTVLVACMLTCGLAGFMACGIEEPSAPVAEATRTDDSRKPPNVLLYIVDTLRADALTPYGAAPDRTPAIDSFARNAIVFENAYAQSSWTRASVASILTSQYPKAHGAENRADRLGSSVELLSESFSNHGYRTGLITTNPNIGKLYGFDQGFDDLLEVFGAKSPQAANPNGMIASADDVANLAIDWFDKGPEPFFLVVLSVDPHSPYSPPRGFEVPGSTYKGEVDGSRHWINRKDLRSEDKDHIRALYAGEVAYADHGFGRIRERMKERDLVDRTISVLTSDHGEEFWEHDTRGHGRNLYKETLHVPLIVEAPQHRGANQRESRRVETIDIFPTVLELAGLPIPEDISGNSLFGEETHIESPVFSSLRLENRHKASVRDGNWKLVWDLVTDEKHLFDVRSGETPATSEARTQALMKVLSDHLNDGERIFQKIHGTTAPDRVTSGEVPDAERQLLIELGYIEEPNVDHDNAPPPSE